MVNRFWFDVRDYIEVLLNSSFFIFHYELCIMNYELKMPL